MSLFWFALNNTSHIQQKVFCVQILVRMWLFNTLSWTILWPYLSNLDKSWHLNCLETEQRTSSSHTILLTIFRSQSLLIFWNKMLSRWYNLRMNLHSFMILGCLSSWNRFITWRLIFRADMQMSFAAAVLKKGRSFVFWGLNRIISRNNSHEKSSWKLHYNSYGWEESKKIFQRLLIVFHTRIQLKWMELSERDYGLHR